MGRTMTQNCEILVLVANGENATLCSNDGEATRLLRQIDRSPRLGAQTPDQSRYLFACEAMMALSRAARERTCDGVVIFAEDEDIMDDLRQVQTSLVSRLMVAHVIGKPSPGSLLAGRSSADAQATFCRAVH